MATVNQIVTFVARQALNDDQPDADLQDRIVDYINDAILDMYERLAQHLTHFNGATQNVVVTNGVGTLSPSPFYIRQVVDVDNNRVLEQTSIENIEKDDPSFAVQGNPVKYYLSGDTINVYPSSTTNLRVRYIPQPSIVAAGDDEEAIPLPPSVHPALKWGTMALMALDERDFGNISLSVAEQKYREYLTKAAQRLSRINGKNITVPYVGY